MSDKFTLISIYTHTIKNKYTFDKKTKTVYFEDTFNKPLTNEIKKDIYGCERIKFGFYFNQPINNLNPWCHQHKNWNCKCYPPVLKVIEFGNQFDQPIFNLPESVTAIYMKSCYSYEIKKLPSNLQTFYFEGCYNHFISYLPQNLENTIIFNSRFLNNFIFPPNLKKLTLSNSNIDLKKLPNSLEYLSFNEKFDQNIIDLPSGLTYLYIGNMINTDPIVQIPSLISELWFKDKLDSKLVFTSITLTRLNLEYSNYDLPIEICARNLKYLSLNNNFNNIICIHKNLTDFNDLPKLEIIFKIDSKFNQPVDTLPINTYKIKFGKHFIQSIDNLTDNVEILEFMGRYEQIINKYPNNLINLTFDSYNHELKNLPNKLEEFNINKDYDQYLTNLPVSLKVISILSKFNKSINVLQPQIIQLQNDIILDNYSYLTKIILGSHFNQPIYYLPPSLQEITFGPSFNQPIDFRNTNLITISFGRDFNQYIDRLLPSSLKNLYLSTAFNKPINKLPKSIKHLVLGNKFNRSINSLPENLESLTIQGVFNHSLDNLPCNLKKLSISDGDFDQPLDYLPSSITELELGQSIIKYRETFTMLPPSLKILSIYSYEINKPICDLPENLEILNLGPRMFNQIFNRDYYSTNESTLIINLPKNLKKITLYNFNIEDTLKFIPKEYHNIIEILDS